MKTSLIKKTARTFFLVQAVMLVTSCSNFLNIDNYFDDEFNIDSVFTNARYMEAYMWGAPAMRKRASAISATVITVADAD